MADAGGEVARVHGEDPAGEVLRGDARVLVAAGHVAGDREVDHGVVIFELGFEKRNVIRHIHRCRAAELAGLAEALIQKLRADVDAVAKGLVVRHDVERRDADVVGFEQLGREIAGAVGGDFDVQNDHLMCIVRIIR